MTSRTGRPWTPAEDATLRVMYGDGASYFDIADALGRTPSGCDDRRMALKIPARPRVSHQRGLAGNRKRIDVANQPPIAFTDKEIFAAKYAAEACTRHLIDLVREYGGGTVGAAKAAYRSRCELDIPPGPEAVTINIFADSRSYCGSPSAMCEG